MSVIVIKAIVGNKQKGENIMDEDVITDLWAAIKSLRQENTELRTRIAALESARSDEPDSDEVYDVKERLAQLEYKQQREADERGYEAQGSRYPGKHPSRCACDRCLRIGRGGNYYG
jgi:hypothetical protein